MKKYLLTLSIAVLTAGTADAQFNMKGLGKKIGKAVKKEVVKKSEELKQESKQQETKQRHQAIFDKLREEQAAKQSGYQQYQDVVTGQAKKEDKVVLEDYEFIIDSYGTFDDKAIAFKGGRYDRDAKEPYGEAEYGIYRFARKIKYWDECLKNGYYDPENFTQFRNFNLDNGLYYVYRLKKAAEKGDTELMTGEFLTRATWCINNLQGMLKNGHYEHGKKEIIEQLLADYDKLVEQYDVIIWSGKPTNPMQANERTTPEKKAEYTQNNLKIWNWCLDKAEAAKNDKKPLTSEFYIAQALGYRYTNIAWGYATGEEPGFADFDARMGKLYGSTSSEFKEKNKFLTVAEAVAAHEADKARWAKEAAEKKAKEEAEIAANTQDWPASNMPSLDATALRVMRAKLPNRKISRVSIEQDHWVVDYKGLVPHRRYVALWIEYPHESGRKIAEEHFIGQYYNGSSWGKTQYMDVISNRYFWVRQK